MRKPGSRRGFQVFYIFVAVGFGLGAAMSALVGNALGRKDSRAARRLSVQGLSYGIMASGLLGCVGFWLGPQILAVLSETRCLSRSRNGIFSVALAGFAGGFLLAYACNGVLQAQGDSTSMQAGLDGGVLCQHRSEPLVDFGAFPGFGRGWGFNGIAASTVLSPDWRHDLFAASGAEFACSCWSETAQFHSGLGLGSRNFCAIRTHHLCPVDHVSVRVCGAIRAEKGSGEHAIAGFGIGLRVEQILLLPVLGMTTALLPILSQNLGAGEFDRVRHALHFCWKIGAVITLIAAAILWTFGAAILGLFTSDPEVIRVGLIYLRIDSVILPLYMMLFSINSLLQALKRPVWSVWIGLYRQGFGIAFFAWDLCGGLGI